MGAEYHPPEPCEGKKGQPSGRLEDGVLVDVYRPGVSGVTDCQPSVPSMLHCSKQTSKRTPLCSYAHRNTHKCTSTQHMRTHMHADIYTHTCTHLCKHTHLCCVSRKPVLKSHQLGHSRSKVIFNNWTIVEYHLGSWMTWLHAHTLYGQFFLFTWQVS